ncbi:MAG: crossover junction endodeoxyribonuclease RuvC [Oscillospiraceae bacterium]|jgi:crossover junction endodeoxyribonuclease RuvC|nr:crossover junction endodeoxyribonuclease RuvC [Oscillospiraceae bacterium]
MLVLGLDPGVATVGFGFVRADGTSRRAGEYGVISTPAKLALTRRLDTIYSDVTQLIAQFKPDAVSIEELYFGRNVTTGLNVAHARGVMLLAAFRSGVPAYQYAPNKVKNSVVGYGKASKCQVQEMVTRLLGLNEIPRPDDAADALAIALCHAQAASSLTFSGENI